MDSFERIKSLYEDIITSLLKGEASKALEKSDALNETEKEYVLFNITDESKIEERSRLRAKINEQKALEVIKDRVNQKSKTKPMYWFYSIAASIVILLGIFFSLTKNDDLQSTTTITANNNIKVGTDKAILTLEDGSEVSLEKGQTYQSNNITSNGETIIYQSTEQNSSKATNTQQHPTPNNHIAYNTLTIPRGAQFQIKLSDGTKVWLNSESQIKYPVSFVKGETRQVELVYGEAYFDVVPSTEYKDSRFKVFHNKQEVEVQGTEFNIKAYKDETNIYTTLVEGKVTVNCSGKSQNLVPTQQSNLNLESNDITIAFVDTYIQISWKDGVFNFKRMPLKYIMKTLSRWYDMDVVFADKTLEEIVFTGTLLKSQAIGEILSDLKNINFIKDFEIHSKTVIIK